jgi:hypothetical protein
MPRGDKSVGVKATRLKQNTTRSIQEQTPVRAERQPVVTSPRDGVSIRALSKSSSEASKPAEASYTRAPDPDELEELHRYGRVGRDDSTYEDNGKADISSKPAGSSTSSTKTKHSYSLCHERLRLEFYGYDLCSKLLCPRCRLFHPKHHAVRLVQSKTDSLTDPPQAGSSRKPDNTNDKHQLQDSGHGLGSNNVNDTAQRAAKDSRHGHVG